jgi:hypothetical protein
VLFPQKAFDPDEPLFNGFHDSRTWQPVFLYLLIGSESGVSFNLKAKFPEEDKIAERKSKANIKVDKFKIR